MCHCNQADSPNYPLQHPPGYSRCPTPEISFIIKAASPWHKVIHLCRTVQPSSLGTGEKHNLVLENGNCLLPALSYTAPMLWSTSNHSSLARPHTCLLFVLLPFFFPCLLLSASFSLLPSPSLFSFLLLSPFSLPSFFQFG